MGTETCWFCDTPVGPGEYLRFGMHRDVAYTPLVIALHTRWHTTQVAVPRCERCGTGHAIERVARWTFTGSALITGLPSVLALMGYATGDPWVDTWQFVFPWAWTLACLALWLGIRQHGFGWHRLAPRPERHARAHPGVAELAGDGWKYGDGPPGSGW
ncbi:hypothetical protein ACFO4E_04195 [Nocardiopsis mangrovi]|uniref:DUF983 domain-containing protein n=1 Tax=Nocardiopsis mangrovi TaxID=1179818 RepID=A0ABV9DQX9_9ACTN